MFWRIAAIATTFLTLSAFARTEDVEQARWQSFIGLTMSQWMTTTGLWPENMYETNEGRVFVLQWVRPLGVCSIQLHAKFNGAGANADGWTIYRTVHQGGCGGI